ncbi:MAG TPA: tetratricopeptide repeat protein [Verrucomicrobiae bacterium]|nr:tetratricopeptide repeat protein [Verrucomicrobiae bacterium]
MESDVTQSAAFYKTWAWAEANKNLLVIAAAGILVVGCGIGLYVWQHNEKESSASQALSHVATQTSLTGHTAPPEAFLKVASQYPNTAGGERALLMGAGQLFVEGKYAEAQEQFQKFLNEHRSSDLAGQAALGVATSLEAQGKTADAIKAYKDITEHRASDPITPRARLALGRLYEAQGELTQARDAYQQLARAEFGGIGQEANLHLQQLLLKNPALAQPPVTATNNSLVAPASVTNAPALNSK